MQRYELLEIKDLNSIISNLKVSPLDDYRNYYSPHYIKEYYENELFLREEIFKFTSFIFGVYDDYELLKSVIIIRDVPVRSNLNSYEIIVFTNHDEYVYSFYNFLKNEAGEFLDEFSRINIIVNTKDTKLIGKLNELSFLKEWVMKEEYNNEDFLQMAYFVEEGVNDEK